ncbi:MAG: hypothetical protein AAFP19_04105 [Bacteroidota bacterium]
MKDHLEDFIESRRSEFDQKMPPSQLWEGIEAQLDRRRPHRRLILRSWIAGAAAAIALLLIGTAIGMQINQNNALASGPLSEISEDMADLELYYKQQIRRKKARLASYEEFQHIVDADLKELEQFMKDLQAELEEVPSSEREKIVHEMVRNYQTRLEVLERVLLRLESDYQKTLKSEEDEKMGI